MKAALFVAFIAGATLATVLWMWPVARLARRGAEYLAARGGAL